MEKKPQFAESFPVVYCVEKRVKSYFIQCSAISSYFKNTFPGLSWWFFCLCHVVWQDCDWLQSKQSAKADGTGGQGGGPICKYSPSPQCLPIQKRTGMENVHYNLAHSNFWTFHLLCSAGNIFWFSKSRRHFWSSILLQNFITIYVRMICIYFKKNILFTGSIT